MPNGPRSQASPRAAARLGHSVSLAIARYPVAPETVTILGYAPRTARDARWAGLRWNGTEELRTQSTLMLWVYGPDAPSDLHLNVSWRHPDDDLTDEDADCKYRVRPRMQPGKRWKGRKVKAVSIERDATLTPPWVICVEYAQGIVTEGGDLS